MQSNVLESDPESVKSNFSVRHPLSINSLPIVLLPGLGGEQTLQERTKSWSQSTVIRYLDLDWRHLVKPNDYFTLLSLDIRRQIHEKLPPGPFLIGGYSIGGLLAFASACDCLAEGRLVAGLIILDAPARADPGQTTARIRARRNIKKVVKFNPRELISSVLAKALVTAPGLSVLRFLARFPHLAMPFGLGPYLDRKLGMQLTMKLFPAWWRARSQSGYRLPIPTLVFGSSDFDHLGQNDLGWGAYCDNVEVVRLNCSHGAVLNPQNLRTIHDRILDKVKADIAVAVRDKADL